MDQTPRERARQRFERRCGYCGVSEENVGASLTLDHHRPRTRGGDDHDANIVYCCPRCNEHKGSYWHETDPPHIYLLHPSHDDLGEHVAEGEDGRLTGLTPEGAFLVQRLRLNRPQLVAYRLRRHADQRRREEVATLRGRVHELHRRIGELDAGLEATERQIARELEDTPES